MPKYEVTADGHIEVLLDKKGDVVGKVRHERGSTVEMSEKDAQRLLATGGLKVPGDDGEDGEPQVDPGLLAYQGGVTGGAGDAAERTTSAPLDGTGGPLTKEDEKVAPSDKAKEKAAKDADSGSSDTSTGSDTETYEGDDWDLKALQEEAGKRELSKSGSKADLAERLRDNDEAQKS